MRELRGVITQYRARYLAIQPLPRDAVQALILCAVCMARSTRASLSTALSSSAVCQRIASCLDHASAPPMIDTEGFAKIAAALDPIKRRMRKMEHQFKLIELRRQRGLGDQSDGRLPHMARAATAL